MFDMHNAERAKAGVAPLSLDAGVQAVARQRASDMARTGEFTHEPSQSDRYTVLLDRGGVSRRLSGENIAWNSYGLDRTVGVAMDGLMNSPGHRGNILRSNFTHVGVGIVTTTSGGRAQTYFAIIFIGR